MARSGIPRGSIAPRIADEAAGRDGKPRVRETEAPRVATNSTRDAMRDRVGGRRRATAREGGPGAKTDPEGNLAIAERVRAFSTGPFAKGREERQVGRNTGRRVCAKRTDCPEKPSRALKHHQNRRVGLGL